MQKYCLVENCHFPECHLTCGHRCLCGQFGHGQIECGNPQKINALINRVNASNISLPNHLHCTIPGCNYRYSHTNSSHICRICDEREHGPSSCPRRNSVPQPVLPIAQQSIQAQNKSMSIPDNSQYYQIKCPTCRTENIIPKSQKPIVGSSIDCIVCYGQANMYLPQCGHINICLGCIKEIDKKSQNQNNNIDHALLPPEFQNNNHINIEPSERIMVFGNHPERWFSLGFDGIDNYDEAKEEAKNIFGIRQGKIFLCSYAGMGCHLFMRRDDTNAEIEVFFMHSDSWGQYRHSEVGELNRFVDGYEPIYNNV